MAIWPFNRNKEPAAGLPPEVQDYYQAESRERSWVAWLLATGTLLVTVLVVLGLFYGGRWGYRKIRHEPKAPTVAVQQSAGDQSQNATTPAPSQATPGVTQGPTVNPQTSSTSTTSSTSATPAVKPAASNPNLPNTGPGDVVAVFAVTAVAAYAVHRLYLGKSLEN